MKISQYFPYICFDFLVDDLPAIFRREHNMVFASVLTM